jgi:hypothetical protein
VLSKLAHLTVCRSVQLLVLLARGEAAKDLELLVLRHQITVLRRQLPRPKLEPADRALLAAVSRALPRSRWSCFFVRPETLLGWHRRLIAGAWTYPHRQTGRPPLDQEVQQLIIRMAKENPTWGYQRIRGELLRLGVQVSATAIRTTLRRHRLDPAPRRAATSWQAFLRRQAAGSGRGRRVRGSVLPRPPIANLPWARLGSGGDRVLNGIDLLPVIPSGGASGPRSWAATRSAGGTWRSAACGSSPPRRPAGRSAPPHRSPLDD